MALDCRYDVLYMSVSDLSCGSILSWRRRLVLVGWYSYSLVYPIRTSWNRCISRIVSNSRRVSSVLPLWCKSPLKIKARRMSPEEVFKIVIVMKPQYP